MTDGKPKTGAPKNASPKTRPAKPPRVDLLPEDSDDVITLYDEHNKPVPFYQIACVEFDDEFYALLQPVEKNIGVAEDEVVIFRLEEEDEENDLFLPVGDEKLLQKIFDEYLKAVADAESSESN